MGTNLSLDSVLRQAVSGVPDAVAASYVDMESGVLMGTMSAKSTEVIDLATATSTNLFQGANVSAVEQMFRTSHGIKDDDDQHLSEVLVISQDMLHIFLRGKKNSSHCLCIVCPKNTNLGMALTKSRMALTSVEGSL